MGTEEKKRALRRCAEPCFRFLSYKEEIKGDGQQDLYDRQTDNDLRIRPAVHFPELIVQRESCVFEDRDLQEAEQEYFYEPEPAVNDEDQRKDQETQRMTGLHREKCNEKSEGA